MVVLIIFAVYGLGRPQKIVLDSGKTETLGPLEKPEQVEIGYPAPDFVLMDEEGTLHRLSDFRGKTVLLNFWASWCPFCREEMPLFEKKVQAYRSRGFEVVAINRGESTTVIKRFTDEIGALSYPLLLDPADKVYKTYRGISMPLSYFIDPNGVIVDIQRGAFSEEGLENQLQKMLGINAAVPDTPLSLPEKLFRDRTIQMTDGVKHSIPLEEIFSGGPPRDGIPSIDNPKFVSVKEASVYLDEEDLGIAVSWNGAYRFYPNQILVWHEIVNDTIGTQPFLITYCPLCGTGIVFEPLVNGTITEFGTSGKLWNSNLVMYDRQTKSLWSQILGEAIVGEMTGTRLKLLPYDNLRFKDWKKLHPNGQVLSWETGFSRDYTRSPYRNYETNEALYFPVSYEDKRYHPKEPTFGIVFETQAKVYPQSELQKGPAEFTDTVDGIKLLVSYDKTLNTIKISREDAQEPVIPYYGFWFSWMAAHPDSEVYQAP